MAPPRENALLDVLRRAAGTPNALLPPGARVLAAVSGGPDSLALLHALHGLRDELGLAEVSAAHFHHGLRGADADGDAEFVAEWCAARGLRCVVGRGDVAARAARERESVQQAARAARYEFLAQAAGECGADRVATAHTRDDQTETVLMNILRGTGISGLRGIPARRGVYVRPLLGATRAQVEAYCAAHGLMPRHDASNADTTHYTRNRVRRELLPLLERDYGPGVGASLLRLSEIAAADADFLEAHARETLRAVTIMHSAPPATLMLGRAGLEKLHPALLAHVLRAALMQVRGTGDGITQHHLAQIAEALREPAGASAWGMTTPAPCCRIVVRTERVELQSTVL